MNESSVSTPFMDKLRANLEPLAVVFKLADNSTVGIPDCLVTFNGHAYWFEFKLWIPPKKWRRGDIVPITDFMEESPTQYATMKRLARAGATVFYIIWVKKSKYIQLVPVDSSGANVLFEKTFQRTSDLAQHIITNIKQGTL